MGVFVKARFSSRQNFFSVYHVTSVHVAEVVDSLRFARTRVNRRPLPHMPYTMLLAFDPCTGTKATQNLFARNLPTLSPW
jgi:hypothetical protein